VRIYRSICVEIFVSSTHVLPLPLPMAQIRWQERVGSVFLCGDCDMRFGVSISFSHCMVLPLRAVRDPSDCPVGGLILCEVWARYYPHAVGDTEILSWLTEWENIWMPSCLWLSSDDFPGCPDSEFEHPRLSDSSDSDSDMLIKKLSLTKKIIDYFYWCLKQRCAMV